MTLSYGHTLALHKGLPSLNTTWQFHQFVARLALPTALEVLAEEAVGVVLAAALAGAGIGELEAASAALAAPIGVAILA